MEILRKVSADVGVGRRESYGENESVKNEEVHSSENKGRSNIKILDFLISLSIFFVFLGTPTFFLGTTMQGLAFEKQLYFYVWLLVGLVAWVTKSILEGEMKIRKTPLDIPILVFLGFYVLSAIFSVDRWHSIFGFFGDPSRGLISILALVVFYYMLISVFNWKRFNLAFFAIVGSNFVVALWSMLAFWGIRFLPEKIFAIAPLSLIGSITGLGIFFSLMLPILLAGILRLSSSEKKKSLKIAGASFMLVLLFVNVFLLFSIYAFTPWLATVLGVSFFLIYIISGIVKAKDGWGFVPMVTFVAIMAILLMGSNFGKIGIIKANLPVEVGPNASLSWEVFKASAKENIFVGSGPSTYSYVFSKYKPVAFNEYSFYGLKFYQGQGMFFEFISTIGIFGSVALAFALLVFVGVGLYFLSKKKEKNKLYSLGFFSASMVFIVSAMLNRVDGSLLIFGAILGALALAVLMKEEDVEETGLNLSLKTSPKFALAFSFLFLVISVGVVFVFIYLGKIYTADVFAAKAVRTQPVSEETIKNFSRAITFNPKESRYYSNLGSNLMALANKEFSKAESERNIDLIRNYLVGAIQSANDSERLMKNDIIAVETVAQIYENSVFYLPEATEKAREKYNRALELDPNNPIYQLKLGQLKIAESRNKEGEERTAFIEEAKKFFEKSLEKKTNFGPGYYNMAIAHEALGNKDQAIENVSKALSFERGDVNYTFELARMHQSRGKEDDLKVAESTYKKIIESNEKHANARFMLAIVYEAQNNFSEAVKGYEELLKILPEGEKESRDKVNEMLANAKRGVRNNLGSGAVESQDAGSEAQSDISVQNTQVIQEENNLQRQITE